VVARGVITSTAGEANRARIFAFIERYYLEQGAPPDLELVSIMTKVWSKMTVQYHCKILVQDGSTLVSVLYVQ
jgi:hypothetical protein